MMAMKFVRISLRIGQIAELAIIMCFRFKNHSQISKEILFLGESFRSDFQAMRWRLDRLYGKLFNDFAARNEPKLPPMACFVR